MSTYVLVHGAWHGSWCWKRVRQALRARGHEVFTPTLTGLGERSHLLSPQVTLDTHIEDVVNLIRWEELSNIVLCGHSYGGMVVTGVADRMPERIASLVYLDAFVPENGRCLFDYVPVEMTKAQLDGARQIGDGWRIPPIPGEVFNVNQKDRAWMDAQCTPQPIATFEQPIRLSGEVEKVKNITYIFATQFTMSPFRQFYEKAKAKRWKTLEMAAGHDVMLDMAEELTDVLLAAAPQGIAAAG
jgi:pimeloyl-ACP methyl ester carboxylesterase